MPPRKKVEQQKAEAPSDAMNAYALRIWNGQSVDVNRKDRIARIVAGLQGQGYTDNQIAGLKLPE